MENSLAIKLPVGTVSAKACMAIKKLTGLSLGEINEKAANDDFVYVCDYLDDNGVKLMNQIKREMKKLGIEVRQYEDGIEKPSELFDNIEKLHKEIESKDID